MLWFFVGIRYFVNAFPRFPVILWYFFFFPLADDTGHMLLCRTLGATERKSSAVNRRFSTDHPVCTRLIRQLGTQVLTNACPPNKRLSSMHSLTTTTKIGPGAVRQTLTRLRARKLIHARHATNHCIARSATLVRRLHTSATQALTSSFLRGVHNVNCDPTRATTLLRR